MDKGLTKKEQLALLQSLGRVQEDNRNAQAKANEKRWTQIAGELTFAEGLARLAKTDLSAIRVNLGIKGASSLNKQALIDVLAQRLASGLPDALHKLDETRFNILRQIAARGGRADMPLLEQEQLDYFTDRAYLFTGTYEGKRTLVMPQEMLQSLNGKSGGAYGETVRRNTQWIKLTHGMLLYYGTLSADEMQRMLSRHLGTDFDMDEYLAVMEEAIPFYGMIRYSASAGQFANVKIQDVEKLRNEQQAKADLPFYPFSTEELLAAGEPEFVDRNPAYLAFVQFIGNMYTIDPEEADFLVEECANASQAGRAPQELLEMLRTRLEINDLNLAKAFMEHIVLLHNNIRRWALKGHTPQKLSSAKQKTPAQEPAASSKVIDFATRKKIGRNDPCPCGSGKKFKKCCGR